MRALPLADVCRMYGLVRYRPTSIQPNHGHTYVLLARTIYIRCIYGIFGRKITKYTVIYGVYVRFWPTLYIWLWPIPKVNTFMAMANTQGQYIHMVMAITQGQYIHMAMANIWPLHSYGYGQYLRSIHSCLWPIPKVNTFIWLWPVPKVNTFMTMANTQGQYIHMVMVNTQGQFIHGYGQYPRSIHSRLWPIPKVNTFIWLWPIPKADKIRLWPIYGHYMVKPKRCAVPVNFDSRATIFTYTFVNA